MVRRQSNSKLAKRASREAERGTPVEKGEYSLFAKGGSVGSNLCMEWVQYHGINGEDDVFQWVDYDTGALIILPVEGGEQ